MGAKKRRARSPKNSQPSHKEREKATSEEVTYDVTGVKPQAAPEGELGEERLYKCPLCGEWSLVVEFKVGYSGKRWRYWCDEGCREGMGNNEFLQEITPEGEDWRTLMDGPQPWLGREVLERWD